MRRLAGAVVVGAASRVFDGVDKVAATLCRLSGGACLPEEVERLTTGLHKVHGRELFPGIGTPLSRTTRYGATFVGVERGEKPVTIIGWINYTPIFFKPNTVCAVVGGRWLLISGRGVHRKGVLYGRFGDGAVRWNNDAKLATASIQMKSTGGPADTRVAGTLTAGLNHFPFPPLPPVIGATLELEPAR